VIPSEAITGIVYRAPFDVALAHYDDPPPDALPDIDSYLAADGARFANLLRAWIDVRDGRITDFGHSGGGRVGSTTLRLGNRTLRFVAYPLPDLRRTKRRGTGAVRFEQTAGGRTGAPAPRRVSHAPYLQFQAPLAWTTIALTLHADGRQDCELTGASPFPRHWLYGADGALVQKSATIDYHAWSTTAFGRHSPWGDLHSPAMATEAETALERQLSRQIMRGARKPELRRLAPNERLTVHGEPGRELFLVLDGVLRVEVDGRPVAEVGPGAILGERALLHQGRRTASLTATTRCLVAVADPTTIEHDALVQIACGHHREDVRADPESPERKD
jgi:hypothetical protein